MRIKIIAEMKRREEYKLIFLVGVLVFLVSKQYFGWNKTAQSGAERVCDFVWEFLVFTGIIGMVVRHFIVEAFHDTKYSIEKKDE